MTVNQKLSLGAHSPTMTAIAFNLLHGWNLESTKKNKYLSRITQQIEFRLSKSTQDMFKEDKTS